MLTRMYVDNYKCFVNFEFKPGQLQLILGLNGTGKSSVLDILNSLRDFLVYGKSTDAVFPVSTLTRWDKRTVQTFELDIDGNGGEYTYKVEIEHDPEKDRSHVKSEEVTYNDGPLFSFQLGDAQLYRDDHTQGPSLHLDWYQSGVATLAEGRDNKLLTWFKARVDRLYCVRISPTEITGRSEREEYTPNLTMSNFAAWFRHVYQEEPTQAFELFQDLSNIIDGFKSLPQTKEGPRVRMLKVEMLMKGLGASESKTESFEIDEMSDGQRALIALYALLHFTVGKDTTLFIDEPDNYVALPEIQPWLFALQDRVDSTGLQALLISHHPELINDLAASNGVQFVRSQNGPVRTKPFSADKETGLTPSETIARGWDE